MIDLLDYKADVYSQNGEDGILEAIFNRVGFQSKLVCEFGAWDGTHFSNTKNLIEKHGVAAVMIEGDEVKYKKLVETYQERPNVTCVNAYVGTGENDLQKLLLKHGVGLPELQAMDLLSIDIDGLDYEIFENLSFSPRVLVIEVNAGHDPEADKKIPFQIAKDLVGQPLGLFTKLAEEKGYGLVCYNGNAFYVLRTVIEQFNLPLLTDVAAYESFLRKLSVKEKEWLSLVNVGKVVPFYRFDNFRLTPRQLGVHMPSVPLKERVKKIARMFR